MLGEHLSDSPSLSFGNTPGDDSSAGERRSWTSRVRLNVPVAIVSGNSSQRSAAPLEGECRDASETGCGVTSRFAPTVGDIYLLRFEKGGVLQADSIYARCVRCHLIREDRFESGFVFMAKQQLQDGISGAADSNESLF